MVTAVRVGGGERMSGVTSADTVTAVPYLGQKTPFPNVTSDLGKGTGGR